MSNYDLKQFGSDADLARAAAERWLTSLATASQKIQACHVALSGGRITKTFFSEIVAQSNASAISLTPVHFFWADERCLPPDNLESNFRMANEFLFQPLGIAEERIHRLKGELEPHLAVSQASADVFQVIPRNLSGLPVFDFIFLGMGEDGHIASLFPNATPEIINAAEPYLAVSNSPKPPPQRLSLSYPVIAAAKEVWVLAAGSGKEQALRDSLVKNGITPLAKVLHSRAQTTIFTDIRL